MEKKYFAGFSVLEISYWCFHAAFAGFAANYFLENGMGSAMLSLISSAYMICAFAGSIVMGWLSDRFRTNRIVFLIGLLCAGGVAAWIYAGAANLRLMTVLYPLFGFVMQPLGSNMDAWVIRACRQDMKVYGRIRSLPSLCYSGTSVLVGNLIQNRGYIWMMYVGGIFLAVAVCMALLLPERKIRETNTDNTDNTSNTDNIVNADGAKEKMKFSDAGKLLSIGEYRKLLIILFLIGAAFAPVNNLRAVIVDEIGGNVANIGIISFIGALTQVPFIYLSGTIVRLPRKTRYLLMSGLTFLAVLLAWTAKSMMPMYLSVFAYNAGYGILLATMRETTEQTVDRELRTLGHSLSEAVYMSFSGAISLSYAGRIVESAGVSAMLAVCAATGLLPLLISLWPSRKRLTKNDK